MAAKDGPAWSSWFTDKVVRYFWRPRHGLDQGPSSINWAAIALSAVVLLALGAAAWAGFSPGDDDPPATGVALPTFAYLPGAFPSAAVSVAPSPAASSKFPPLLAKPSTPPARPSAGTPHPTGAGTTHPPAARAKTPVWQERIIESTSVLTTGQSWSTNRLRLTVTGGGDLVLQDQGKTVWRTGTTTGVKLVMQNDGHLVLYDASDKAVWTSGTAGNPGAVLILRADGNMVISLNGRILFQTGTGD